MRKMAEYRAGHEAKVFDLAKGTPVILLEKRAQAGVMPQTPWACTGGRGGLLRAAVYAPAFTRLRFQESPDGGATWAATQVPPMSCTPHVLDAVLRPDTDAYRFILEPSRAGMVKIEAQWWP
jgi:hypothetical protein